MKICSPTLIALPPNGRKPKKKLPLMVDLIADIYVSVTLRPDRSQETPVTPK